LASGPDPATLPAADRRQLLTRLADAVMAAMRPDADLADHLRYRQGHPFTHTQVHEAVAALHDRQPAPARCDTCQQVRPLIPDWKLCQPCYQASAFDPDITELVHGDDPLEREDDPVVLAEHQAADADAVRYGEYP
ncbi:hypothetical protein ACSNOI_37965, partial [Actinomadura kijaniata]|uniref:hypothetical protein n=1 Tax=Actinomadura kijaniata TaxID=46161 RepID=UPI003F1B88F0